jgi:hypothetical protein
MGSWPETVDRKRLPGFQAETALLDFRIFGVSRVLGVRLGHVVENVGRISFVLV